MNRQSLRLYREKVSSKTEYTWYIDFVTYARKDFFDSLENRVSVLVEITEENGNTHQGRAIFTCIDSTLDEPIVYRMEGITELEPVKLNRFQRYLSSR